MLKISAFRTAAIVMGCAVALAVVAADVPQAPSREKKIPCRPSARPKASNTTASSSATAWL